MNLKIISGLEDPGLEDLSDLPESISGVRIRFLDNNLAVLEFIFTPDNESEFKDQISYIKKIDRNPEQFKKLFHNALNQIIDLNQ